ncbi:MotB family protein [Salaquimonas pukyongi]|uniref:MotB family protein n=1 Tax=Salaquimonas pukyongi TaxID=2712698 RepID=UPI00096B7FBE|nr:MotB family protein [Salaquimonas pukyongi]
MKEDEMAHGEIIIIRRGHGDHDDHHGGVWKIAFADFMTAMMAFFLVMWLINASNEETKKAVASYFNPVKLMDTTTNPRGVKNPKYGDITQDEDIESDTTTITSNRSPTEEGEQKPVSKYEEQAIFVDPFSLISDIAGGIGDDTSKPEAIADGKKSASNAKGLSDGKSFQDPFDPTAWNLKFGDSENTGEGAVPQPFPKEAEEQVTTPAGEEAVKPQSAEKLQAEAAEGGGEETQNVSDADAEKTADANQKIAEDIRSALENQQPVDGEKLPFEVENMADGTIKVALMEGKSALMFSVGSAKPTKAMIMALRDVANTISGSGKNVSILGHTDGRPYRGKDYDNWRLSTARAHMARYVLIDGGLSDERFERIEGHADRTLKFPDNPFASGNRRIELILRSK